MLAVVVVVDQMLLVLLEVLVVESKTGVEDQVL